MLKIQITLSVIFIFTLIVSISLSYNAMTGKDDIYTDEEAAFILRFNRTLSLIIALGFLFINIGDKKIKDKYNLDDNGSNLQIMASALTLISSLIVLYVAFSNSSDIISNENPGV